MRKSQPESDKRTSVLNGLCYRADSREGVLLSDTPDWHPQRQAATAAAAEGEEGERRGGESCGKEEAEIEPQVAATEKRNRDDTLDT